MFFMTLGLVFKCSYVFSSIIHSLILYLSVCFCIETSSNIDTTSSQEITTTHTITSESPILTTETDPLVITSVQLSTNTDTSVESSTSYIRKSGIVDF